MFKLLFFTNLNCINRTSSNKIKKYFVVNKIKKQKTLKGITTRESSLTALRCAKSKFLVCKNSCSCS